MRWAIARARASCDAKLMRARFNWVVVGYGALGGLGATLSVAFGGGALTRTPWLGESPVEGVVASLVLGVAGAALAIILTRLAMRRAAWARALHGELRPLVKGEGGGVIVLMALASSVGEELFFRGFLSVTIGVVLSSLAFGALHQVRGRGRIGWAASAFAMGVFLSLVYGLTGQLVGCIVAHALVNVVNLQYLRDHDPNPKPRKLGGLLASR
ncbi:MAG TPA: CPBP family intramembrane glutamic endopeptidase [Polyangiaceae bacterium]